MPQHQGAYYRLTKNISTDGRTNFSASYFSGTLDGAGFTITGLQKPLIQQNAGTIKDLIIVADFDYDSHDILYGFENVPSPSAGAREELLLPMIR